MWTLATACLTSSTAYAIEPIEVEEGEPAPADGVWLSSEDALFLLSEVERLMLVEDAYKSAIDQVNDNFRRFEGLSEPGFDRSSFLAGGATVIVIQASVVVAYFLLR